MKDAKDQPGNDLFGGIRYLEFYSSPVVEYVTDNKCEVLLSNLFSSLFFSPNVTTHKVLLTEAIWFFYFILK